METINFESDISLFQNVVILLRNSNDELFIGNTYFYNGRLDSDRYMSVMYKDPLPANMGIMAGWNYLDDNSPTVELIPERNMETGIEDFLYAHGMERDWHSIEYHVIQSYPEIESYLVHHPIQKNSVIGFGIK